MPIEEIGAWGTLKEKLERHVSEKVHSKLKNHLNRLDWFQRNDFENGFLITRENYANAVAITTNWLHDIEVDGESLVISSGSRPPYASLIVEEPANSESTIARLVGSESGVQWHWEVNNATDRVGLLKMVHSLQKWIGAR